MSLLASFAWHYLFDMPNIMFLLGAIVAVAGIIASAWRKTAIGTEQLRLKQMMVQRGYSPEDIVRVASAGASPNKPPREHRIPGCC